METRTITKTITVYHYEELDEQAQNLAMNNLIVHLDNTYTFWVQDEDSNENLLDTRTFQGIEKANRKADDMQTPWFVYEYIFEEIGEELKAIMIAEKWLFTKDGTFFPEDEEEGELNEHQSEGQPG